MSAPTLVMMHDLVALPRRFSQLPMMVSDSPPWWPGTQREYTSAVSMALRPESTKRVEQVETRSPRRRSSRTRCRRRPAAQSQAPNFPIYACPCFSPCAARFRAHPADASAAAAVRATMARRPRATKVASGPPFAGASASWPPRPARHRPTNRRRFRAAPEPRSHCWRSPPPARLKRAGRLRCALAAGRAARCVAFRAPSA